MGDTKKYGVPEKIVNTIKCLYDDSTSVVLVEGILSMGFLVTTGALQGDTLATFLFIIVLDFALQTTEITSLQTHPAKLLCELDLADDMILLDQDETEATEHFQTIESCAKKVRLNINYDKTNIMINVDNPRTEVIEGKLDMKEAENTALDIVNDFKYLVAYIANCHVDFK